jgi:hypothetical protein
MRRRTFLKLSLALPLLEACEAGTERLGRAPDPDSGSAASNDAGGPLFQDGGPPDAGVVDSGAPPIFEISQPFDVLLNDSTCSKHSHWVSVEAAVYTEDTPVHFLGGSHELIFLASELVLLEQGNRIPFATIGPGPGHGHCGTAWRMEVGPEEPNRPDQCQPRGTAQCMPA